MSFHFSSCHPVLLTSHSSFFCKMFYISTLFYLIMKCTCEIYILSLILFSSVYIFKLSTCFFYRQTSRSRRSCVHYSESKNLALNISPYLASVNYFSFQQLIFLQSGRCVYQTDSDYPPGVEVTKSNFLYQPLTTISVN